MMLGSSDVVDVVEIVGRRALAVFPGVAFHENPARARREQPSSNKPSQKPLRLKNQRLLIFFRFVF